VLTSPPCVGEQGTGLGSAGDGITEPIKAQVKNDKLGVGTADPSTIGESDDIYEAYKKRMMTYVLLLLLFDVEN
jgi:hypothetical protein